MTDPPRSTKTRNSHRTTPDTDALIANAVRTTWATTGVKPTADAVINAAMRLARSHSDEYLEMVGAR